MKTKISLLLVIFLMSLFAGCEKEDKGPPIILLQGDFKGNFSYSGTSYTFYFRSIEQQGERLYGDFEFGRADGEFSSTSKLVGNELYIKVVASGGGVSLTFVFDGTVNSERERMNGHLELCLSGECVSAGTWSASKISSKSATENSTEKSAAENQFEDLLEAVKQNLGK